jgi:hypothetical protein
MNEARGPHLPFIRRLFDLPDHVATSTPGLFSPVVLVIEPEDAVRAALAGWLLGQGFLVWTAADQEEALTVYRQHGGTIALVVEDLRTYWLTPRDTSPKR